MERERNWQTSVSESATCNGQIYGITDGSVCNEEYESYFASVPGQV